MVVEAARLLREAIEHYYLYSVVQDLMHRNNILVMMIVLYDVYTMMVAAVAVGRT